MQPSRPFSVTLLAVLLLAKALLLLVSVLGFIALLAGELAGWSALADLAADYPLPWWLGASLTGVELVLAVVFVLSAVALLCRERWALSLSRTGVGLALLYWFGCTVMGLLWLGELLPLAADPEQGGSLLGEACCCDIITFLLLALALAPSTNEAWRRWLTDDASTTGPATAPPPPPPPRPMDTRATATGDAASTENRSGTDPWMPPEA